MMIAVRTDRSAVLARSRIPSMPASAAPDEEVTGDALLVKAQRPAAEGRKPASDADLCFGCVDWYMYPRRQPGAPTNDDTG